MKRTFLAALTGALLSALVVGGGFALAQSDESEPSLYYGCKSERSGRVSRISAVSNRTARVPLCWLHGTKPGPRVRSVLQGRRARRVSRARRVRPGHKVSRGSKVSRGPKELKARQADFSC